eukprot:TRINITY_DN8471_c0_g1_i1.p1 TRINITY_DN8471_c0_g1~~TRINITY_DN8471_c0_g1_i1.p1  ORF type:complete len:532 (+),score=170.05 TRINITY_DN8471_c0_g1_i1:69-1664(+)
MAARVRALWFRVDLRLDDNLTLKAACEGAQHLLPVYVFDPDVFNRPTYAGARKSGPRRARFLLESVANLRKSLEAKGSGLAVCLGKPSDILPRVCNETESLWVTQGICSEEKTDEHLVKKRLKSCKLQQVWQNTLYMPDDIGQNPDDTPLLFTNFKNKAESRGRIRDPIGPPGKLPPLPDLKKAAPEYDLEKAMKFMPSLTDLGFDAKESKEALEDDPRSVMAFEGGEDAAMNRLNKWMWDDDHLREYFEIRNGMKGEGYSSKQSPWLALGCISPRRIWKNCQQYEKERTKNKSTYWLVFELTWRDFYVYMGRSFGDKIFYPGGITGDAYQWKGGKDALLKWKQGRTGDQLVDANMRELLASGFMSNRGRQNVASYLIFDLGVDWRYGAAHFEEHLLDHDPCSNWGNWVAAAGLTGQRVNKFNTRKQLMDYDPKREYVRLWLNGDGGKSEGGGGRAPAAAAADEDEDARRRARAERFGTGPAADDNSKGKGKGGGYGGKGGSHGKGKDKGSRQDRDEDYKKARRWAAKERA